MAREHGPIALINDLSDRLTEFQCFCLIKSRTLHVYHSASARDAGGQHRRPVFPCIFFSIFERWRRAPVRDSIGTWVWRQTTKAEEQRCCGASEMWFGLLRKYCNRVNRETGYSMFSRRFMTPRVRKIGFPFPYDC